MQTNNEPIVRFSKKYDIDLWYCFLTEKIFEGLPDGEYQSFPYRSIEVLPINYDFNNAKSAFHRGLLTDQLQFIKKESEQYRAIKQCIDLFSVPFNEIDQSTAESAEHAAWYATRPAVEYAADSADSAVEYPAEYAPRYVESAVEYARCAAKSAASYVEHTTDSVKYARYTAASARSAVEYARCANASNNYYIFMRDLLLKCIKENL